MVACKIARKSSFLPKNVHEILNSQLKVCVKTEVSKIYDGDLPAGWILKFITALAAGVKKGVSLVNCRGAAEGDLEVRR